MADVDQKAKEVKNRKKGIVRQSSRSVHDLLALVENTPTVPLIDGPKPEDDVNMSLKSGSLMLRKQKSKVSTKNINLNAME